eukprot:PhM_4_TR9606/c0_g1_i1/m.35250
MNNPWDRFLDAVAGSFSEEDLAMLYWDTVRSLCDHFNFTDPMDLATIELRWKKLKQRHMAGNSNMGSSTRSQQQDVLGQSLSSSSDDPFSAPPHHQHKLPAAGGKPLVRAVPTAASSLRAGESNLRRGSNKPKPQAPVTPTQALRSRSAHARQTPPGSASLVGSPDSARRSSRSGSAHSRRGSSRDPIVPSDLVIVFDGFAAFGDGNTTAIDSARCVKLCKDCGIIPVRDTAKSHDVEIEFARCRRRGERKLNYETFRTVFIPNLASKLGCTVADIVRKCLTSRGPVLVGTVAEPVKWHDDRRLYTGVYRNGGPTVSDFNTKDFKNVADRTKVSDVRGVQVPVRNRKNSLPLRERTRSFDDGTITQPDEFQDSQLGEDDK